jgi:hypothetical protein
MDLVAIHINILRMSIEICEYYDALIERVSSELNTLEKHIRESRQVIAEVGYRLT